MKIIYNVYNIYNLTLTEQSKTVYKVIATTQTIESVVGLRLSDKFVTIPDLKTVGKYKIKKHEQIFMLVNPMSSMLNTKLKYVLNNHRISQKDELSHIHTMLISYHAF